MVMQIAAEEIGEFVESLAGDEGGGVEVDSAVVVDPGAPSTVFAGTNGNGVYRSMHGGASWSRQIALPFAGLVEWNDR